MASSTEREGPLKIPYIAITTGDPAGIGPEISLKASRGLRARVDRGELRLVIIGSAATQRATAAALELDDPIVLASASTARAEWPAISFIDVDEGGAAVSPSLYSAESGRIAYEAIAKAVKLALSHDVDAICTGPISKEALNLAGHHYNGHTELLADLTGARDSVMLLVHGNMRVSHVTTHTALRDVPDKVVPHRIRRVVELTDKTLRVLGLERRHIAIAALNPHAGEGGLFGREDIEVTGPTVESLQAEGYDVEGPIPGDTVFVKLRAGQYDAVVAMYHDQGHIPVKLLGFSVDPETGKWNALSGVNVTLGLPIIRTSVDHGTAFDIAGRGIASETSLIEAIDLAIRLA
jgi:4-phospho-D-threonate 3-dehydrogenase / 4-phospho-D-erythronate 3-dehydrogenase